MPLDPEVARLLAALLARGFDGLVHGFSGAGAAAERAAEAIARTCAYGGLPR